MQIEELYEIFLEHPIITTDSRSCPQGSIFFALRGENFDGNVYASKALAEGCAYAVIDRREFAAKGDKRYIVADNALQTMQDLAAFHREKLALPVIQITGTNGKTTTKELVSTVLAKKYNVLHTEANYNNHIGVPKTLLRLGKEHEIAVIETGANHRGEIAQLTNIVHPDYGIITNVGRAHLEGFGSFEGVVHTKAELYDYLRKKKDGAIFLNSDSEILCRVAEGLKAYKYGTKAEAHPEVLGEVVNCDPYISFKWKSGNGEWHTVETKLIGDYNIANLLAAVAVLSLTASVVLFIAGGASMSILKQRSHLGPHVSVSVQTADGEWGDDAPIVDTVDVANMMSTLIHTGNALVVDTVGVASSRPDTVVMQVPASTAKSQRSTKQVKASATMHVKVSATKKKPAPKAVKPAAPAASAAKVAAKADSVR